MSLRGKAAIVGIGETPHRRVWPGRSALGLCAEAAAMAIADAGLRREEIDGLMTFGFDQYPANMGEYIGVQPSRFAVASGFWGGSSGCAATIATHVVAAGTARYVLFVGGGARDPANPAASIFMGGGSPPPGPGSEWIEPYGPTIAANNGYGLLYTRHMYRYGTTQEQLAHLPVNQRFNAQQNPLSAFRDQPITVEDVLNSRYVNYPLHLLESVMPVAGAIAYIVSSAELAKTLKQPPTYILGAGTASAYANNFWKPDMTTTPVAHSSKQAYEMSGYGPLDIQFAEFYDWYSILEAVCLEDAGVFGIKKGEIGPFFASTDTTYRGTHPINTDGGQLSAGQLNPAGASGTQQIVEAVRQIRGQAGERQVARHDIAMTNGWGGSPSQMATLILGSAAAL